MLLQIPDVLTPEELRALHAHLGEAAWRDGRATAGTQAVHAKNNEQVIPGSEQAKAAQNIVLQALSRHALFFSATLPRKTFPPQFNRYGNDTNRYDDHVDGAIMHAASTGERVRTDISCTLFLSDPSDYDGGELVINGTFGAQTVKLPAGHLVLYPSSSVHRVQAVTRGQRIASFFWIESMVRRDDQRRLLFDMDMDLLRLRAQHGEDPSVVGLTGLYHNLLRMWADA
jgi:PKHD-type hydroxylase